MSRSVEEALPPWVLTVTAMFVVQLGSALSMPVMREIGAGGTAWLRLTFGAIVFILIGRPNLKSISRSDLPYLVGLGVSTGLLAFSFLSAMELIPLGTAVAIEFLGPLTVAAIRSHNRQALIWPALALLGVLLLTQPWLGEINIEGVAYALLAAVCWGLYIVLTQEIGDRYSGMRGLALTIPIAALTAGIFGIPQAIGNLSLNILLAGFGLAILLPIIPYALELMALRRMTSNAFGTLMALEPAIGVILGILILQQIPNSLQVIGILLVVYAGASAQRGGLRKIIG